MFKKTGRTTTMGVSNTQKVDNQHKANVKPEDNNKETKQDQDKK